jgi:hypothetical protein
MNAAECIGVLKGAEVASKIRQVSLGNISTAG